MTPSNTTRAPSRRAGLTALAALLAVAAQPEVRQPDPPTPAAARELRRFDGHGDGDSVVCVRFSPDGKTGLACSFRSPHDKGDDSSIRLWNLATGEERLRLAGNDGGTRHAVFTPDGKRVLSGGLDNLVRLWDAETGAEIRRFEGHTEQVVCVAVTSDGRRGLSASADGTVRLWNLATGAELKQYRAPDTGGVSVVVSAADDREVVAGYFGGYLVSFDAASGEVRRRFPGQPGVVMVAAVSRDGKRLLSANTSGPVVLWNLETGDVIHTLVRHAVYPGAALTADGRRGLSSGEDGVVRVWDLDTGAEVRRFNGHAAQPGSGRRTVWSVDASPDGRTGLSGSIDRTMRLWELGEPGSGSVAGPVVEPPARPRGALPGETRPSYGAALLALRMSVKLADHDLALDVDGNGTVDARDAAVIAQRAAAALGAR